MGRSFVCRLLNTHKWERIQTRNEEAYRCGRCGKRHYGQLRGSDLRPFTGGDGGGVGPMGG